MLITPDHVIRSDCLAAADLRSLAAQGRARMRVSAFSDIDPARLRLFVRH